MRVERLKISCEIGKIKVGLSTDFPASCTAAERMKLFQLKSDQVRKALQLLAEEVRP